MLLGKEKDFFNFTSSIQRTLLYILLVILPFSVLPFPWDPTEKGMSIVLLSFVLFIVFIELIKVVWSGRITFLNKSVDILILSLFLSYIFSTIFARDFNLSFFGFNYRFGPGLLVISSILILSFLVRGFIKEKKEIAYLINAFLIGSIIVSFLSILSLFGTNFLSIFPQISSLAREGLPIIGSPIILVLYNCISLFLAYISFLTFRDHKFGDYRWLSIFAVVVNIFSISLFALDQRALLIVILFIIVWLTVFLSIFFKDKSSPKSKIIHLVIPLALLTPVLLVQIPAVSALLLGGRDIVSPLTLSVNFSWNIVSQSLMASLKNGIFGLGLDSFGVAFTAFKPLELLNLDILSAYNEILTSLANGGFLWLVIWLLIGWYLIKDFINDFKNYDKKSVSLVLFDGLILFLFLSSFLVSFTLIIRFVFFFLISLWIVYRNILKTDEVNNIMLKIWAMGSRGSKDDAPPSVSIFLSILLVIVTIIGFISLARVTISSLFLLRAEDYIVTENERFDGIEATDEEREIFVNHIYSLYSRAYRYDRNNPVVNRKLSLASVDRLSILIGKYQNTQDTSILNDAVYLRNDAFELSRNAVNRSPSLYANYNNRAMVYLGIINLGYTEYIRDGLAILNDAIAMKPLDYQNYYYKGQLYYLLQEYDQALQASTQSLSIKGDFIPSLILSASINGIQGNVEIQLSYLNAVRTILEHHSLENTSIYDDVLEQIKIIERETGIQVEDIEEPEINVEELEIIDNVDDLEIDKLP